MLIINYNREKHKQNLKGVIFGLIFSVITFIGYFISPDPIDLTTGGIFLGITIFLIMHYLFEKRKQYLSIEDGIITKNSLFPNKVNLKEVIQVKEFAGDLKLITKKKEFIINTNIIEPSSLDLLKSKLEGLGQPAS